ncbi:MAG TPA: 3-isopropylmalate dehydratase small subunit [Candidatus Deferrimicrobium sp.]|nr:3-isopropylmalate dehydratase small subunit [Candidatus Deferrimicrobium sp.]
MATIKGKIWKFGDNIDTDVIIPGRYLTIRDPIQMASHTFEPIRPEFVKKVVKGDIIVGGANFGSGSSREEAPFVLKTVGIAAIVAESFARIFYRNAINLGIPLLELKNASHLFSEGDTVEINFEEGIIKNLNQNTSYQGTKLPKFLMELIDAGGAILAVKQRIKQKKSS